MYDPHCSSEAYRFRVIVCEVGKGGVAGEADENSVVPRDQKWVCVFLLCHVTDYTAPRWLPRCYLHHLQREYHKSKYGRFIYAWKHRLLIIEDDWDETVIW